MEKKEKKKEPVCDIKRKAFIVHWHLSSGFLRPGPRLQGGGAGGTSEAPWGQN